MQIYNISLYSYPGIYIPLPIPGPNNFHTFDCSLVQTGRDVCEKYCAVVDQNMNVPYDMETCITQMRPYAGEEIKYTRTFYEMEVPTCLQNAFPVSEEDYGNYVTSGYNSRFAYTPYDLSYADYVLYYFSFDYQYDIHAPDSYYNKRDGQPNDWWPLVPGILTNETCQAYEGDYSEFPITILENYTYVYTYYYQHSAYRDNYTVYLRNAPGWKPNAVGLHSFRTQSALGAIFAVEDNLTYGAWANGRMNIKFKIPRLASPCDAATGATVRVFGVDIIASRPWPCSS